MLISLSQSEILSALKRDTASLTRAPKLIVEIADAMVVFSSGVERRAERKVTLAENLKKGLCCCK